MKPESFSAFQAGRLIRVGRGDAAYWAFVPHPLPPTLLPDAEIERELEQANNELAKLRELAATLPDGSALAAPFVRMEAIHSSRIEGIEADLRDLYAYDAGIELPAYLQSSDERDLRLTANYVEALHYASARLETLPLSLRLLREMHEILLDGEPIERVRPGDFRTSQNWIGPPGALLADARFVPPPVPEMHEALDAFEKYLYADDGNPPLIRLAFAHYQLEAIHPFLDGNGRIGRLLLTLLTEYWGLLPLPLLSLSTYFDLYRHIYYDLLLDVSERGAWREWVLFFLKAVTWQAATATDRLTDLLALRDEWRQNLSVFELSEDVVPALDYIIRQPVLSSPQLESALGLTNEDAVKLLEELTEIGIVDDVGGKDHPGIYQSLSVLTAMGW